MTAAGWVNTALSATAGAALAVLVGFAWGGWMSSGAAERLASQRAETAIGKSWTPYCLAQSREESARKIIAELKVTFRRNRPGVIQNAGWATPIGESDPSWAVARSCALALAAQWGED